MVDIFDMEDGINQYLEVCKARVCSVDNIILFGSARTAEKVWEFLETNRLEYKVRHIIDNDVSKQGKTFHDIMIDGVRALSDYEGKERTLIIIASGAAHIIKRQLLEMGIPEEMIAEFTFGNMQTNPTPYEYFKERSRDIDITYNLFEDEKLKNVFIGLLKYRISKDVSYLSNITDDEKEQYFDRELIQLSEKECFVDCGAFVGDTMCQYAELVGGNWEKYYCFEADKDVFAELSKETEKFRNVELYNIGCWSGRATLYFESLGSGSSQIVNETTGNSIEADSLDHILGNRRVTFIKMDIEGAERRALEGAEAIIKREKPILAISTYHSLEDFIYLP